MTPGEYTNRVETLPRFVPRRLAAKRAKLLDRLSVFSRALTRFPSQFSQLLGTNRCVTLF